jgi:hypothetical protein
MKQSDLGKSLDPNEQVATNIAEARDIKIKILPALCLDRLERFIV